MSAIISRDGLYRYKLVRQIYTGSTAPPMTFVMLNPSTADAEIDDPTIRRCIGFARRELASSLIVVNLYAFRATNPKDLWKAADPVGHLNAGHILQAAEISHELVCAWGKNARTHEVNNFVSSLKPDGVKLSCLGVNKDGSPRHPLYIKADQPLIPWGQK